MGGASLRDRRESVGRYFESASTDPLCPSLVFVASILKEGHTGIAGYACSFVLWVAVASIPWGAVRAW